MQGKLSVFGGPSDTFMKDGESLSLFWLPEQCDKRPDLFFPKELRNPRMGCSKWLQPGAFYIALRYNQAARNHEQWRKSKWRVSNPMNGIEAIASLVDWGPSVATGRLVDMSPGLAQKLGVETDDEVEVEEVI